jgi:hypothetical protein
MYEVDRLRSILLLIVLIALTATGAVSAIDTGSARVHIAGPDTLLLEGVRIEGDPYIVYLAADDAGSWRITSIEPQADGILPWDIVLDIASLSIDPGGQLRIDNVFLNGQFYSGAIAFDEEVEEVARYRFFETDPPDLAESELLRQLADAYGLTAAAEPVEPPAAVETAAMDDGDDSTALTVTAPDQPAGAGTGAVSVSDSRILERLDQYAREGARRLDLLERRVGELSRDLELAVTEGTRAVSTLLDAVAAGSATPSPGEVREVRVLADSAGPDDDRAPTLAIHRAREEFSVLERPDMSSGQPLNGEWRVAAATGAVSQLDDAARYAKLRLAYEQDSRPRLYRLVTRAPGDGWAGTGLHFSITDVERPRGYGHGRSVLVWLTRDSAVYGTDATFLELYVSDNDVDMNRVVQVPLGSGLKDDHALEVLFDPGAALITVAVNGVEHVRYRLPRPAITSVELALRALGQVEYSDLEVRRR